jgi:hypothetical protein
MEDGTGTAKEGTEAALEDPMLTQPILEDEEMDDSTGAAAAAAAVPPTGKSADKQAWRNKKPKKRIRKPSSKGQEKQLSTNINNLYREYAKNERLKKKGDVNMNPEAQARRQAITARQRAIQAQIDKLTK